MTNLETAPAQEICPAAHPGQGPCVQLWPARNVPLGGVRAMTVSRTLPQRGLPTVGAWCFLDSFGPDRVAMSVLPHPHMGLQTVTWPLTGSVRHRDSVGSDVVVRPGELNIMTAGRGISHSEFSVLPSGSNPGGEDQPHDGGTVTEGRGTGDGGEAAPAPAAAADPADIPVAKGLQLWVALPDAERHRAPAFEQHKDLPQVTGPGFEATVMVGTFAGKTSPATMYSPIVGADVNASGSVEVPLDPDFEHAVLVLDGGLSLDGESVPPGPLAYLGAGRNSLNADAEPETRLLLLGGRPFEEDILMWWNFVARTHEEVVEARSQWESLAAQPNGEAEQSRFGLVKGHGPDAGVEAGRIPAPELPSVRLRPRTRG